MTISIDGAFEHLATLELKKISYKDAVSYVESSKRKRKISFLQLSSFYKLPKRFVNEYKDEVYWLFICLRASYPLSFWISNLENLDILALELNKNLKTSEKEKLIAMKVLSEL
jgi:hypothetical protein